jgi:hypothetical protein
MVTALRNAALGENTGHKYPDPGGSNLHEEQLKPNRTLCGKNFFLGALRFGLFCFAFKANSFDEEATCLDLEHSRFTQKAKGFHSEATRSRLEAACFEQ